MILLEHEAAVLAGWIRRDKRPIWEVADNRYGMDRTRAHGERWQLSKTPWVKQILEDAQNPSVREIVLMAGSQCAKTAPMLVVLAWSCANRPSPKLWITGNDDLAKDASQERLQPTLERSPDSKPLIQDNRLDKTTWKIRLSTCTIDIAGAQSSTALEQNPYNEVFGDEIRQWPAGSLQKVEKRQRSYTDAKRYLFSTPDKVGDEFHQRFLAGTRNEWIWPCMKCGAENKLEWKEMKYDHKTDSEGTEEGSPGGPRMPGQASISLECKRCTQPHFDVPEVRRHICEAGHWQAQNQAPEAGVVSYHWNALLPPWVAWADLVKEWKRANELKKQGNIEPLKVFICETLGEPWEERAEDSTRTKLDARRIPGYHLGDAWECKLRIGAADVQRESIYWAVRGWNQGGESRLIEAGQAWTMADLQEHVAGKLLAHPRHLMIDSGYKTAEVYLACNQYGWKPCKGTNAEYYSIPTEDGKSIRSPYHVAAVDAAAATQGKMRSLIRVWEFSSGSVKDMLSLFMTGQGGNWGLPEDTPHEYIAQLLAEQKEPVLNKDKVPTGQYRWKVLSRDNHFLDCECMILVGALDAGLIQQV